MYSGNRTAVFYDIENVREVSALEEILKTINELLDDRAVWSAAYSDWSNPSLKKFMFLLQSSGILLQQVATYGPFGQTNASDIALAVEAVEKLQDKDIDNYIIVSGDNGFSSLVNALKRHKKKVIVISMSKQFGEIIKGYADKVFIIDSDSDSGTEDDEQRNLIKKESARPYFKVLWGMSKNIPKLKEAVKMIFKLGAIKEQMKHDGVPLEVIYYILKMSGHQKQAVTVALMDAIDSKNGYSIKNVDGIEYLVYNRQPAEIKDFMEVAKENIVKEFEKRSYLITKGSGTGEIISYIAENYKGYKKDDIANISKEISKALGKQNKYVVFALELLLSYGFNSVIGKQLKLKLCKKIATRLKFREHKNKVVKVIYEDIFHWGDFELELGKKETV